MKQKEVIIVGASEHAKVVIDNFENEGKYHIIGLLDVTEKIGRTIFGYAVIGEETDLPDILCDHSNCELFVAIGGNWVRQKVCTKILSVFSGVKFASTIHPSAQIGKNVGIGNGVVVMPGAIINCDTIIDDFVIVNTSASVDHDCRVQRFSSLAPGVTIGGKVSIGSFSAISIGATIKHGVTIGDHSITGAGALLMKNCGDNTIMYGLPTEIIRRREVGDKYL